MYLNWYIFILFKTRKSLFIKYVEMQSNVDVFQDVLNPLDPRFHMNTLKFI